MYSKDVMELANKYSMPPIEINSVSLAFDAISRLSCIENIDELDETIVESFKVENKKRIYTYDELPIRLKQSAIKALNKYGVRGIGVFYNDLRKSKNLETFLKALIKNKIQPKEFIFNGVLSYRELKREPMQDNTNNVTIKAYED